MKKLFLLSIFALFAICGLNAQGQFRAGVNAGLPIGDAGDFTTFAIAVDLGYLFDLSDDIQVGPGVGYSTSFLKSDFDGENISFLPITANGRYQASENLALGLDLGYAVGINEGNEGGLYFAPVVEHKISNKASVVAAYRSVNESGGSGNFSMITFGILIHLLSAAVSD